MGCRRRGRDGTRRRVAAALVTALAAVITVAAGRGTEGQAASGPAGPAAGAAPVTVVVRTGEPAGRVPELGLGGFNFANFMQVVGFEREFAAIGIRSIRFPAGNLGDQRDRTPADLDLLRRHWLLLGRPRVVMQARVLGGTPEQAAEAARYAAAIGLPIAYWEIGNEPDLYPPAGSWTPEGYCEVFRAFVDALRPVAAGARFAGPAVSGGAGKMEWVRRFVAACGDVVDVVTWHVYPTDGTAPDDVALASSAHVSREIEQVRGWLRDPESNPLGWRRAGEVGLGVTEFGLSWRSASFRHLADLTAALWTADVVGRLVAGGVELAQYFALQDTGGHGLLDSAGFRRPTYPVFRMLREFDGVVLPVALEVPAAPGAAGAPQAPEEAAGAARRLSAYAVEGDDGVVRVLLINADPARAFRVDVVAAGVGAGQARLTLVSGERLTQDSFDRLEDAEPLPAALPVSVPPRSVTLLRLGR